MGKIQENQQITDKFKSQMTVRITPESLEAAKKLSSKMKLKPGASINEFFNQLLLQAETMGSKTETESVLIEQLNTKIDELNALSDELRKENEALTSDVSMFNNENNRLKNAVSELGALKDIFETMNETPDAFNEKLKRFSELGINENTIFLNLNEADFDILESLLIIAQKQNFAATY